MTIASKADIAKYLAKLEEYKKKCDDDGKPKPKVLLAMLRSIIRQVWMKAPNKLAFLLAQREVDTNTATKTKWLYTCRICFNRFKEADVEVDHIQGNKECTGIEQLPQYIDELLNVGHDDLQMACKVCHGIKSYSEKHNMTFEEADIEKQVIAWLKKNNVTHQKRILNEFGFLPEDISNGDNRRDAYRSWLNEPS